jgi:glucan phosphoethanolaminetransferase (alkaline phosphatase superfamily)
MNNLPQVSKQTRNNWWVDLFLFTSGIVSALSGIYFLFLPTGGYKGGANPFYNIRILFLRATWEDIHAWGGLVMIVIALLHIPLHWSWFVNMTKRMIKGIKGTNEKMGAKGRYNLYVNLTLALSGLTVGLTGLYFFFIPGAAHGSGLPDPMWLFSRTTWDLVHTWAFVVMLAAAILHFTIHWKWITKVTTKLVQRFLRINPIRSNGSSVTPILAEVRHD